MPLGGRAVAGAQQVEEVVEPAPYLLDRHRAHAGRRQLDGERQPVEAGHDVGDRVGRQVDVRPSGAGALHEERRRVVGGELAQRHHLLGGQPQRRAAGGQHVEVTGGDEQQGDQGGHGLEHVLAVVEDQQRRSGVELGRDPAAYVGELRGRERTSAGHRPPHAQGRTDLGKHVVAGGHADQLDEVHPGLGRLAGEHVGDAGLAEPARADDGDQPAATDGGAQLVEVALAAEQGVGLEVHAVAHRAVGRQQLAVQPLEGRVRVDAEPVGQVGAVLLVALQGRRRPGGGRDAAQQCGGDGHVVDGGCVRGLEVGERVLVATGGGQRQPEHPPDPAPVVGRVEPELGERAAVRGRLADVECRRPLREVDRPGRVAGVEGGPGLAAQPAQQQRVHVVGRYGEPVPAVVPDDAVRPQRRPDPGHQHLQRLGRVRGLVVGPDQVDQPAVGEALGSRGQRRKQCRDAVTRDRLAAPGHAVEERQRGGHPVRIGGPSRFPGPRRYGVP